MTPSTTDRDVTAGACSVVRDYEEQFADSRTLYERAKAVIAGGVTHDKRYHRPFPVYAERASGCRKWDVQGRELIDYWSGHGSLLLGHCHPAIVEAVRKQVALGTHLGACHELEVEWAERIVRMVPSAQRVRFTSSGTEATLLAVRLTRAFSGKDVIVKFAGHFHGWHDHVVPGWLPPFDQPPGDGILSDVTANVRVVVPNDASAVEEALSPGDVAAVIIEPTGGAFGAIPTDGDFLKQLRQITQRFGVLLHFDEVITGFRVAPGGAQEHYGITPDITTLAKIVAGGLPGGAVTGRADILDRVAFHDEPQRDRYRKVAHPGTFNANPVSAAAGIACLDIVADGRPCEQANAMGALLRDGISQLIARHSLDWRLNGSFSGAHLAVGRGEPGSDIPLDKLLQSAMLLHGIDVMHDHFFLSCMHREDDIQQTIDAFDRSITLLKKDGLV